MVQDREYLAEAVEHILRLRAAERSADPPARAHIASAREFIETTIGPTVRPASAARLLHVSQTALNRWLEKGEVASVLTPEGRRELPLPELLDLIEAQHELQLADAGQPLAAVLRHRRLAADEAVNIDRLLPQASPRGHRAAELKGLAYHRLVAERLDDPTVEMAGRRLARWRANGRIHPQWADEWERILAMPLARIRRAISADTPHARALRQSSPFTGVLNEHERRRLLQAVEQRVAS
jgi:hypothetical protein